MQDVTALSEYYNVVLTFVNSILSRTTGDKIDLPKVLKKLGEYSEDSAHSEARFTEWSEESWGEESSL